MDTADSAGTSRTPDFVAGRGRSILVVDDEVIVRMLLVELLAEAGFDVVEAHDGPSALRALEGIETLGLLVTDVGLPGGMNGRQLADAIRQARGELGVLFVTGYVHMKAIEGDAERPNMRVIAKPFTGEALLRCVDEMLARPIA